jgi:hypothetical protein
MCETREGNEHVQSNSEVFSLPCVRDFDCALAIMSKPVLVTQQLADHAAVISSCSTRPVVPCIAGLTEIYSICFAPYGFALMMNTIRYSSMPPCSESSSTKHVSFSTPISSHAPRAHAWPAAEHTRWQHPSRPLLSFSSVRCDDACAGCVAG